MDNQDILLVVIGLILVAVGGFYLVNSSKRKKDQQFELPPSGDKPIIPRDQRDHIAHQSHQDNGLSSSDSDAMTSQSPVSQSASTMTSQTTEKTNVDQLGDTLSSLEHATADIMPVTDAVKAEQFEGSSNLLDDHMQAQDIKDQNSALHSAAEVVSLTVLPNQVVNFDGDTLLQLLDTYGLKFGEMNLFHRYEETDGSGSLLFSVMRYSEAEGTLPFDLQTLSDETVDGLTFFLPLPHPKASAGIGAMLSMAASMARDLNATVYDEKFETLERTNREALRDYVTNYQLPA